jgi:hypothetical protein
MKVSNSWKLQVIGALVFYLVVIGSIVGYGNRYDWGLVKPKFKVGDCVTRDLSTEFTESRIYYKILKIGKHNYLTEGYLVNFHEYYGRPETDSFDYIDDNWTLSDVCGK